MSEARLGTGQALTWSWRLLAALILLAAVGYAADRTARTAPHLGYLPADAEWTISTDNLPAVWEGLSSTAVYEALLNEMGSPIEPGILELRKMSGLRFTPLRWRLFVGESFAAARTGDDYVFVVHPGLVPRFVEWVSRSAPDSDAILEKPNGYYAWRDGFCIASRSRELVAACLSADAIIVRRNIAPNSVHASGHIAGHALEFSFTASDRLPLEIAVKTDPPTATPALAAGPWPDEIARIDGLPTDAVRDLVREAATGFWSEESRNHAEQFAAYLPANADGTSFVLTDIEVSQVEFRIDPHLFVASAPAVPIPPPGQSTAFASNNLQGWTVPDRRPAWTHVSDSERGYLATSPEVMHANLSLAMVADPESPGGIYINWVPIADKAAHAILQAAEFGHLGELSRQDAGATLVPYARAAAKLGETELTREYADGKLVFRGHLSARVPEPPNDAF